MGIVSRWREHRHKAVNDRQIKALEKLKQRYSPNLAKKSGSGVVDSISKLVVPENSRRSRILQKSSGLINRLNPFASSSSPSSKGLVASSSSANLVAKTRKSRLPFSSFFSESLALPELSSASKSVSKISPVQLAVVKSGGKAGFVRRILTFLNSLIPEQEILRNIFTVFEWEKWKKSSWTKKSNLITFYMLCLSGVAYYIYSQWKSRRNNVKAVPFPGCGENNFDVIVVGAGPAGNSSAYHLCKFGGKKVLVLDKETFPRKKVCGGLLTPSAQHHLQKMGVLQEILDEGEGHWVSSGGMVSPTGSSFVSNSSQILCERLLNVKRETLDLKMAQASSREGATVIVGTRVKSAKFDKNEGLWTVYCVQDGVDVCHRARMLVAADGAKSKLARKLSVVNSPPNGMGAIIVGNTNAGYHPSNRLDACCFYPKTLLSLRGFLTSLNHTGGLFYLCAFVEGDYSNQELGNFTGNVIQNDGFVSKLIQNDGITLDPLVSAPTRTQLVNKNYSQHFLCVGDAAGQADPLSQEGIRYSLEAGQIAAQTILEGWREGDLSENALSKYSIRCQERFGGTFTASKWIGRLTFRFPFLIDLICRMIKRHAGNYLKGWSMIMKGQQRWLWLMHPHFLVSLYFQLVFKMMKWMASIILRY